MCATKFIAIFAGENPACYSGALSNSTVSMERFGMYDPNAIPDFSVKGFEVLITGGTGGIGAAFTRAFHEHGAKVIATDLKPPGDTLPTGVSFKQLDVRDDAAINDFAKRVGKLDVLIHCAGVLFRQKEFEIETFKTVVDIHLVGAMRLAMAFRPQLAAAQGSIILIGSMYSYFGSPFVPGYTAAKTGIVGLTRSLAVSLGDENIRCNAIAPGWIVTEMSRRGREDPVQGPRIMARLPNKRWGQPMELAGTALFLASRAAKLVNGVTIPVDGGYVAS
jgi:NAD(P)-dependent dehydrogenase (short-subunit alcohol dehydrogenase family)